MPIIVPGNALWIAAPDDGYVTQVGPTGKKVKPDTVLFIFQSPALKISMEKAEAFCKIIEVSLNPWKDGRIDELINGLDDELEDAEREVESSKFFLRAMQDRFSTGEATAEEVRNAEDRLKRSDLALATARRRQSNEPKRSQDTKEKLEIALDAISKAIVSLKIIEESLTIKATETGIFTSMVAKGAFVKKGDVCGELTL